MLKNVDKIYFFNLITYVVICQLYNGYRCLRNQFRDWRLAKFLKCASNKITANAKINKPVSLEMELIVNGAHVTISG